MSITAAKLMVEVDANTAPATRKLNSFTQQTQRQASGLMGTFSGVKSAFSGMFQVAGGMLAASAVQSMIGFTRDLTSEALQA